MTSGQLYGWITSKGADQGQAIADLNIAERWLAISLPQGDADLAGDEHPHRRCPHDRRRDPAKDDERPTHRESAHHRLIRSQ